MAKGIRSYGPGKFSTILDSYAYELAGDGVNEELSLGDGGGWYGYMELDEEDARRVADIAFDNKDLLTPEEENQLTFASAVIFYERSDGFVEAMWFDNPKEAEEEWADIEDQFGEEEDDEDDEDESEDEEDDDDVFSHESMQEGYVIADSRGGGYVVTHELKHFGSYDDIGVALGDIEKSMKRENFYPNIYYVNDHGNVDLLDSEGNTIKSRV